MRPFFINPQAAINIWYVPGKKDEDRRSRPGDILTTAKGYMAKHGTDEFEELLRRVWHQLL